MKWMLVVIGIMNGGPEVSNEGVYENMTHCFFAREQLIWDLFLNPDGQPPQTSKWCVYLQINIDIDFRRVQKCQMCWS